MWKTALSRPSPKLFKGYLLQISLSPFLNVLSHFEFFFPPDGNCVLQLVFTCSKLTIETQEKSVWNTFKVSNKDTRTTSMTFWCLYCYFTPSSSVSIVNFEHVKADWDLCFIGANFKSFSSNRVKYTSITISFVVELNLDLGLKGSK